MIWQSSIIFFFTGNNTEKDNISAMTRTDHCVRTGNKNWGKKKKGGKKFSIYFQY